jgi:hypothetical protein
MMLIPSKIFKEINKYLNKHISFNKLNTIECNIIITDINEICKKYNIQINPTDIISIRDTFIYLMYKTKGTFAHRIGDLIFIDYKNKKNIIEISNKYELPPMITMYQILIEMKYESHKIEKMIKNHSLPKDIQTQMPYIIKNDPTFWFPILVPNIHNKLIKLKCQYKLKYDLKKNGKCPDILFDSTCNYNKKSFNWIVFKPYILFDSNLHMHDIQKTIMNFNRFGTGLILYNNIICSKSFIKKINTYVDTYDFLN